MRPEDLVERHYSSVYNLAYRTLGRREDAQDVAQQTFARALPRLHEVRRSEAVRGWLLTIAANICQDEFRRRGRVVYLADHDTPAWLASPDPDRLSAPAGAAELHELRVDVWRAALSLPPQQRLVLALRELHGMSYAELADVMRTSVAAIETLLFRARRGFRRAYDTPDRMPARGATCADVLARLSASIDSELTPQEQSRIDAHVPNCPDCQFAAHELRATARLYALVPILSPTVAAEAAAVLSTMTVVGGVGITVAGTIGSAIAIGPASGGAGVAVGGVAALGAVKLGVGALAAVLVMFTAAMSETTWPAETAWAAPRTISPRAPSSSAARPMPSPLAGLSPSAPSVAKSSSQSSSPPQATPVRTPTAVLLASPTDAHTTGTGVLGTRAGSPNSPPPAALPSGGAGEVATPTTGFAADRTTANAQRAEARVPVDEQPYSPPTSARNQGPQTTPGAASATNKPVDPARGMPTHNELNKPPEVVTASPAAELVDDAPSKATPAGAGKPSDIRSVKPAVGSATPAAVPEDDVSGIPTPGRAGGPSDGDSTKPPAAIRVNPTDGPREKAVHTELDSSSAASSPSGPAAPSAESNGAPGKASDRPSQTPDARTAPTRLELASTSPANSPPVTPLASTSSANSLPVTPPAGTSPANSLPVTPPASTSPANSLPVTPPAGTSPANSLPVTPLASTSPTNSLPVTPPASTLPSISDPVTPARQPAANSVRTSIPPVK
jgi:RNA polymerase sigma-70 factor (ECF subfamily)